MSRLEFAVERSYYVDFCVCDAILMAVLWPTSEPQKQAFTGLISDVSCELLRDRCRKCYVRKQIKKLRSVTLSSLILNKEANRSQSCSIKRELGLLVSYTQFPAITVS